MQIKNTYLLAVNLYRLIEKLCFITYAQFEQNTFTGTDQNRVGIVVACVHTIPADRRHRITLQFRHLSQFFVYFEKIVQFIQVGREKQVPATRIQIEGRYAIRCINN